MTTNTPDALLPPPCPVCPPEKSDVAFDWKAKQPYANYVRCECQNCGISGQFRPSREEAIDALNVLRRPLPAERGEAGARTLPPGVPSKGRIHWDGGKWVLHYLLNCASECEKHGCHEFEISEPGTAARLSPPQGIEGLKRYVAADVCPDDKHFIPGPMEVYLASDVAAWVAQGEGVAEPCNVPVDDPGCALCGEEMKCEVRGDENGIWHYRCRNEKCSDHGKIVYSAGRKVKYMTAAQVSPAATRATGSESPEDAFLAEVRAELIRARAKFPGDRIMTIALAEEFGELCKAVLDEPAANVRREAVQTAVMCARVVLDGDGSVNSWRAEKGLDALTQPPSTKETA